MAVRAVQNNTNDNREYRMSYLGVTALGSACGYSARWLMPIAKSEKNDKAYQDELILIRKKTAKTWHDEIEKIREEAKNSPDADRFIKTFDNDKKIYLKAKKTNDDTLMAFIQRANSKAIECKNIEQEKLNIYTKKIRSASAFITIGAFIGLAIALLHNVHKDATSK